MHLFYFLRNDAEDDRNARNMYQSKKHEREAATSKHEGIQRVMDKMKTDMKAAEAKLKRYAEEKVAIQGAINKITKQ